MQTNETSAYNLITHAQVLIKGIGQPTKAHHRNIIRALFLSLLSQYLTMTLLFWTSY